MGLPVVLQRPVCLILHGAQLPQSCPVRPHQSPQDDGEAIAALCLRHAVDDLLGLGCHVLLLVFPVAVAAVVAGRDGLFPEIVEDVVAQAPGSPAVPLHDLKAAHVPLLYQLRLLLVQAREVLFLQQEPVDDHILGREEQDALGRLPVPPGAAGLLIVVLHALGHVVVDDVSHV